VAALIQRYADAECETGAASVEDFDYSCSEPAKTLALLNRDLDATCPPLGSVEQALQLSIPPLFSQQVFVVPLLL
jgi:hypothetical protein